MLRGKNIQQTTYNFVWLSKERRARWEGVVPLLNFLIPPFPFFHTQHIPVFTVHVAMKRNTTFTSQKEKEKLNVLYSFCQFNASIGDSLSTFK